MANPEVDESKGNSEDSEAARRSQQMDTREGGPAAGVTTELTPMITGEYGSRVVDGKGSRKDKGRLHTVRHGVLSRYPLEALRRLGEDPKNLRRLEHRFRAELKPDGVLAEFWFDRFWSSYLRCLLAARTEASALLPRSQSSSETVPVRELVAADLPTLVLGEGQKLSLQLETLKPDVLHQLALVQRYDKHFSNEMFRALAMLLILRRSGINGLGQAMAFTFGIEG
jgi:hypothetical protein